jgi:hypothetical protein
MARVGKRPVMKVGQMNNAKTVESFRQSAEKDLLVLDGNPERLSQSDPGDFANGGFN